SGSNPSSTMTSRSTTSCATWTPCRTSFPPPRPSTASGRCGGDPMSDRRRPAGRLAVTAALVLTLAVAHPGGAQTLRDGNCPSPPALSAPDLPLETLSFKTLTAKHLQTLTVVTDPIPQHVLQTTIDRGGRFNEIERGATVVALTKQGRRAKLL